MGFRSGREAGHQLVGCKVAAEDCMGSLVETVGQMECTAVDAVVAEPGRLGDGRPVVAAEMGMGKVDGIAKMADLQQRL